MVHATRMEHGFSILIPTPREIAARWKCSANLVRKTIDNGELPAFRAGAKLLRIHLCDLEAYEEAQSTVRRVDPLEAMLGAPRVAVVGLKAAMKQDRPRTHGDRRS